MKKNDSEEYITRITDWAKINPAIECLALVGSHIRNEARPDSDIDLVIISAAKDDLVRDSFWVHNFGRISKLQTELWGMVTSLRVFYSDGQEIEFGVAPVKWADLPPDPGTKSVVSGGMIILVDKRGRLSSLAAAVRI